MTAEPTPTREALEAAGTLLRNGMWHEPEPAAHDIALALDRYAAARVEAFVAGVRKMHDEWQRDHAYCQGMSGGYGNPLLAVRLMERIERLAKGDQP